MELKTKNLLLRPIRSADLEALFAIYSNAKAMKYWSTLPLSEPAQMAEVLKDAIDGTSERTTQFSVLYQGRVIGRAGFWPIPEIGYILHPDFWRCGFGTEVLGALIQHGFENCGFDHLFADVDPDNAASIRLLEKAGFHEAGRAQNTIQIGGKWFDSVYFRLDAPA